MKNKFNKILKNRIFIFVLGGVLFGAVSVYAVTYFSSNQVTYDNGTSKLQSTNVQGAIDELYNTCSKAVSSGEYIYYAITQYREQGYPSQGILYRCNLNGGSCSNIKTVDGDGNITF